MRTWSLVLLLLLLASGCTATDERPGPVPPTVAPATPSRPFVVGRVLHTGDGDRLRVRLGLRGQWSLSSVVPEGDGYLVTDDRWFEGTVGMHRLDGSGHRVASWASTGPALAGPDGGAAWVSLVVPESMETGPTLIHTSDGRLDVGPLVTPVLEAYDGEVVTFTALQRSGRRYVRRTFATELEGPPRRVSG